MKNKIISIYQILFGLGGIILFLLNIDFTNYLKNLFIFVSLIFFVGLTTAGFTLLKQKKIGLNLSIIFQALQILSFNLLGVKYIFTGGSKITFNLFEAEVDFALFANEFFVGLNTSNEFLAINLIPIIVIILLLREN